jgi:predicted transcriptional regulator
MARPSQDVTEAELSVLRALWDLGSATIRQLTDLLYPEGGASRYATVQKLLERLEGKGFVERERGSAPLVFAAAIDRGELIGRRLQAVAETLCDGSLTPILTHLVQSKPLSAGERKALRQMVDRLDREAKANKS